MAGLESFPSSASAIQTVLSVRAKHMTRKPSEFHDDDIFARNQLRNLRLKMDIPTVVVSIFSLTLWTFGSLLIPAFAGLWLMSIFSLARNGEGEWKVRKHGDSKRRTWRKVHLGLDVKTGQIRAALMTHQDVDDASALPGLLAQIPVDEPIETIGGDGAYDTKAVP